MRGAYSPEGAAHSHPWGGKLVKNARTVLLAALLTVSGALIPVVLTAPSTAAASPAPAAQGERRGSVPPVQAGTSKPVRDLPAASGRSTAQGQTTDVGGTTATSPSAGDGAAQADAPAFGPSDDLTAPLTSFAGLAGGGPPDPVGDVGPNHYVQMINSQFQVFNKDGTTATGGAARNINTIWTSNAVNDNGCDTQNAGDPIVLYDQNVDRWMLSQFTSPNTAPFDMCIAYSQTPDPTGVYNTYSFRLTASHDYMKYGIWPDGLYMSTYEGGSLGAYVFDSAAMISGSPATFQYFGSGSGALGAGVSDSGRVRMFPSDWDGINQPVVGEPNHFLLSKDSGNGQGGTQDVLEMYDFHVDWTVPANSTFGLATSLPTVPFDTQLSCANTFNNTVARECVPQQGTTVKVDALPGRLMHRVQYRNFGDHRSMVAVQSAVDSDGADKVGSRWYELRNSGAGWSIYQQGTYAPGSAHRWMGSAALDGRGNIAMGYSYSDPTNSVFPSVAYTGRLANAPLGSMPETEQRLVTGTSSQTGFARWGDYSSMNVDPVDDCTFWYTGQFNGNNATQIGSFRFASCNATDLRISKTGVPDPVLAGQVLTYTMTVANAGPVTADSVVVTDVLPAGVTFLSTTPACTNAAGTLTCPLGSLLAGQSRSLVVQVKVPADYLGSSSSGTLTNTASVAATNQGDTNLSNNTAAATTTVNGSADVSVSKICKPDDPAVAGSEGFCDIIVDNLGPSDASGVTLQDVLSSATPFRVVSVAVSPSGSCSPTSTTDVTSVTIACDLGTEPVGGRTTVRITVTADDIAQVNDLASATSTTVDPDKANNSAQGRISFVGSADLSLVKTGPASVIAGTQIAYRMTVSNGGPSTARDVVVQDVMPAGVSFVSVTPSTGTCTSGQPGARDLRCGLGNLARGAVVTIDVVGLVAPDVLPGTLLFNEAVVSSSTADPDNDDVRASVRTEVRTSADLSVLKSGTPSPVLAGNPISYTITASNAGPSTAQGVTLTDTLPDGTTFVSGQDGNGTTVCTLVQTGTVICALGSLAPAGSRTVYLTVSVGPAVPKDSVLSNSVVVGSSTPDPTPGNNTAVASTSVDTAAEMWLDKTGTQRSGNPSPVVVYTLTAHNGKGCESDAQSTPTPTCGAGGPSDAQGVQVVDKLPLDPKKLVVQYVSPQCSYVKTTHMVTCSAATVPAGASVSFVIEAQVNGSVGTILNKATLTSATFDPQTANNVDDVSIVVKGGTGKK